MPHVKSVRAAVIDVGTNSVKLLVADLDSEIRPVLETGIQTRLGQGLYPNRQLQPEAIARTASAVRLLAERARQTGASRLKVFATSAAREALNQEQLVQALQAAAQAPVEIISGTQEAEWAFHGVRTHPQWAAEPIVLVEVGGGSTQFLIGQSDQIHFRRSYPLGAVRLWEQLSISDPPCPAELATARRQVAEFLESHVQEPVQRALTLETVWHERHHAPLPVAVGGTATVLARMELQSDSYDRNLIESVHLTRARIEARVQQLWSLSLAERRQLPGLPSERADLILTGAVIYEQIMHVLGLEAWRVSTRGLRFAAIQTLRDPDPEPLQRESLPKPTG
jgi:exopolyphosphatase/guanosine-5'-triphosphate,3'-diphosphate pyrophosphatase